MDTENEGKLLRVKDSSVTEEYPHRTHEIVLKGQIVPITFKYGEDKILPFEQGIKFMKDGFIVEEVDGSTLDLPVVPTDSVSATLKKDECVARFSELKTDALKLRAGQKNGGELYLDATEEDRKEILAFLIGTESDTIDDEENLIDDEDEDEGDSSETIDVSDDEQPVGEPTPDTTPAEGQEVQPSEEPAADTDGGEGAAPAESDAGESVSEEQAPSGDTQPEGMASDEEPDEGEEQKYTLDEVDGATDEAMRLAAEHGIALQDVAGTGENGNILVGDVEAFIAEHNIQPLAPKAAE